MDKNTVLALILSLMVVMGYQYWEMKVQRRRRPPAPPVAVDQAAPGSTTGSAPPALAAATATASPLFSAPSFTAPRLEKTLENDVVRVRFMTEGARIRSFTLTQYTGPDRVTPVDLVLPSDDPAPALGLSVDGWSLDDGDWAVREAPGRLVFSRPLGAGMAVEKEVSLAPASYSLEVVVRFSNSGNAPATLRYSLTATTGMTPEDEGRVAPPKSGGVQGTIYGVAAVSGGGGDVKLETDGFFRSPLMAAKLPLPGAGTPFERVGNTAFGGSASKYFALVLAPGPEVPSPVLRLEQEKIVLGPGRDPLACVRASYTVPKLRVKERGTVEQGFLFFGGPKLDSVLRGYPAQKLEHLVDFNSWAPGAATASSVCLGALRKLHGLIRGEQSWGLAIIVLTVLVRLLLHPLSRWSIGNTLKMQKLAPSVKEIQERYKSKKSKDAQQKMQLEIMELYRANGASPLFGCLPTLMQLPVFYGLYNSIAASIEFRQAHFIWIQDLSRPDRLFSFGSTDIWFFGGYFNLLPVLMVVSMVIQQKLQPQAPDPQQQQSAKMMQWMTLFFGALFYHIASGLVLYFFTSSLLGLAEQKWVKYRLAVREAKAQQSHRRR